MSKFDNIAPRVWMFEGHLYTLDEDMPPFESRDLCREKIKELKESLNCKYIRFKQHKEKFFIYRKHGKFADMQKIT